MNEYDRLYRQAQRYKELFPKGTRILLLHMGNDPRPVEDNMRGTVIAVDDMRRCRLLSKAGNRAASGKPKPIRLQECFSVPIAVTPSVVRL